MTALLGSYAVNLPIDALLWKAFSGIPCDIATLRGARLATTSELPEGVRLNEALVKQITGGGKITARFLRENPFTFLPQFKLWFDGNVKPVLSMDDAVWDRFAYLPFTKTFSKDDSLLGRLKSELPGILNWCLSGWRDYLENDLFLPEQLKAEKAAFKAESNQFGVYVDLFFDWVQGGQVTREQAYYGFTHWWQANYPGKHWIPTAKQFAAEMRKLGLGEKTSQGRRYWLGITSNEAFDRAKKEQEWAVEG
jgi:putative DNA primase/helicase